MSLFVDTSAFYALLDSTDANHPEAAEVWRRVVEGAEPAVTTNYVVVESTAVLQRRLGLPAVRAFIEDAVPMVQVEWVTREHHGAATSALLAAGRRGLSLVDCTSFEVMRRLGLRRAFAFDPDFEKQGFELVTSSPSERGGGGD